MKEAARSVLESVSQEVRDGFGDLKVDAVFSLEHPLDALTVDVDAHDLVVIGMGRRYGISPYHFARTAAAVVRGKRCPVVVVPVTAEPGSAGSWSAWTAPIGHRRPCDGRRAKSRAGWRQPRYDLRGGGPGFGPTAVPGRTTVSRPWARGVGSSMAAELAAEHTDGAVDRVLVEDAPAAAVLRACVDGDLVVLGARETDQPTYDVLGSTITDVLRDVAVPVVIVARPLVGSN